MADFTKGPWSIGDTNELRNREDAVGVRSEGDGVVAYVWRDGSMEECGAANASLIASAPDMYDALKAILGFFESGEFVRDTSNDFEQGWHLRMIPVVKSIADAKDALAKAEGKVVANG